jgi:hypothetical protein
MIRLFALCAALALLPAPALAQMSAEALGKPLQVSDLARGTVTVRVIQGALDKPAVGVDVELVASQGDATRSARTDVQGRATFVALEPGTSFVARVATGEGETRSDPFTIPDQGGLRLMLSPVPFQGAAAAAPGAAGQMPSPRGRSGVPIAGQMQAGALSVALVRDAMDKPVAGALVKLVGYDANGGITYITQQADDGGRVVFEKLRNDVAYYAMALVEDNGAYNRLRSVAVVLRPDEGSRLLLSTDGSGTPVDDLGRLVEPQPKRPAAPGEVVVRLRGGIEAAREVELLEVGATDVVAKAPVTEPRAEAGAIDGGFGEAIPGPDQPVGTLAVVAARTIVGQPAPLPNVPLEVQPVAKDGEEPAAPITASSGAQGLAAIENLVAGQEYLLSAVVEGQRFESKPFVMPAEGGLKMGLIVEWEMAAPREARFSGVPVALDKAYVAQLRDSGKIYRSAPFQLAPDRGAVVGIFVFPKLLLSFHLGAFIDNEYMGFQGQLTLQNSSYEPYDPGPGGLVLPMAKGFVGAQVGEDDQEQVKVHERGFVRRGVLPPGGTTFTAGFSLPVNDGKVDFDMPLPYGAYDSNLNIMYTPGMQVQAPTRQPPSLRERNGRRFYQIGNITILPERRMVMSISGLPHHPVWHTWARYSFGIVGLGLLGWAMFTVLSPARRRQAAAEARVRAELEDRREALLAELVTLEREHDGGQVADNTYEKRKKKLRRQLEDIYAKLRGEAEAA